jgi:hypothetical protein
MSKKTDPPPVPALIVARAMVDLTGTTASAVKMLADGQELGGQGPPPVRDLVDALREFTDSAMTEGTGAIERSLWAQHALLHSLSLRLTTYLTAANQLQSLETYTRLLLKCESQKRCVLATLADIRHPRRATFIKQQNQAVNQQVVNSPVVAETGKILNSTASELSKVRHELLPDSRTSATASGFNPHLATVDAQYRTANVRRESQDALQWDEARDAVATDERGPRTHCLGAGV